jgi:hypothetical protein
MAEDPGACTLAVRMATGDAYSDEEIERDLVTPLKNEARTLAAQAGGGDARAAFDMAADRLARQKMKETLAAAKEKILREKTDPIRRARISARQDGIKSVVKTWESFLMGTEHRAIGASASTSLLGLEYGNQMLGALQADLDQMPGLFNRIASVVGLRTETGFARAVKREVARLNGDTSQAGGPGDDERGRAISHAARAIKAALDDAVDRRNDAGAVIDRYPGYSGRMEHDAILVGGGYWVNQRAIWKWMKDGARELATSDEDWRQRVDNLDIREAQRQADRLGFTPWRDYLLGKDRGKERLRPDTFDGVAWEDLAQTEKPNDRFNPTPEEDEAPWDGAARDAAARAEARELHQIGMLSDPNDVRELFLYRVYQRITAQRQEMHGAGADSEFVPQGGNLALKISKSRVFHWTSVDDEMDYAAKYSRTPFFGGVVKTLMRAGHDVALMEDFGPNIERGKEDARQQLLTMAKSETERRRLESSAFNAPWEVVTGRADIPVSLRFAETMKNLRNWNLITKLGSVILSKPADVSYMASTMSRMGAKWLQGYGGMAESFGRNIADPETRLKAKSLGAGLRNLQGRMMVAYSPDDARPGLMAQAAVQTHRVSGFALVNEQVEHTMVTQAQAYLADHDHLDWGELPGELRQRLSEYELGPQEWDLIREARTLTGEDGQKYFTTDPLDELAKAEPEKEDDVYRTKALLGSFFHDQMRLALNEPGPRQTLAARAPGSVLGLSGPVLRKGTPEGEIAQSLFQFKSFVTGAFGRHFVPAFSEAMRGNAGPLVHLMLSMTLMGYLGMQLKALSRGEVPKTPGDLMDMHPGMSMAEAWTKIWGASMAQGGGLGLLGDYLFGEMDRNGKEFSADSFMGPTVGQGAQVLQAFQHAVTGNDIDPDTGKRQLPGELVRLLGQNLPVINTWYTRLAIDYLMLWRLQEAVNPGYLDRYQQRQEEKASARYWFAPTTPGPYGS